MKIIDLFKKIANGEEVPRKFTYKGFLWEYDVKNKMWFYYFGESKSHRFDRLFYLNMILNDEVEILDKKEKIEKLNDILRVEDLESPYDSNLQKIWYQTIKNYNKINELIDEVNKLQESDK